MQVWNWEVLVQREECRAKRQWCVAVECCQPEPVLLTVDLRQAQWKHGHGHQHAEQAYFLSPEVVLDLED